MEKIIFPNKSCWPRLILERQFVLPYSSLVVLLLGNVFLEANISQKHFKMDQPSRPNILKKRILKEITVMHENAIKDMQCNVIQSIMQNRFQGHEHVLTKMIIRHLHVIVL